MMTFCKRLFFELHNIVQYSCFSIMPFAALNDICEEREPRDRVSITVWKVHIRGAMVRKGI